jgi:hypothetical protein
VRSGSRVTGRDSIDTDVARFGPGQDCRAIVGAADGSGGLGRSAAEICHGEPWASNRDAAPWLVAGSASVPGLWGPLARPVQEHKGPANAAPSVPHHTRFSFAPTHPLHFSVALRRLGGAVGSFAAAPGQTQEEEHED